MPPIPYKKTATSEDAWDGPAMMKNCAADPESLRAACAWIDPDGDPAAKGTYRFIHHEISADGEVGAANVKACQSGIGVLNGGRGGTTIPEEDRQGVHDHLASHIVDAGMEAPELRSAPPALQRGHDDKRPLVRSAPKGSVRTILVGGKPGIQLQIIRYNVVDSYGSVWLPGCLTKSLNTRLPQLAWSHTWSDPIGRALQGWSDTADGPVVDFYLDDFEAVPRAKQAYAQVQSGTIDDCSVGFSWGYLWRRPTEEEVQRWPGVEEVIEEAELDEVSLVLRGAVPGAKVLAVRSDNPGRSRLLGLRSPEMIDKEEAARIITQFAADFDRGEADLFSALEAVRNAAVVMDEVVATDEGEQQAEITPIGGTDSEDEATAQEQTEVTGEETIEDEGQEPEGEEEIVAVSEENESKAETGPPDDLSSVFDSVDDLLAEREAV